MIDHLVYAAPDLAAAVRHVATLTGVDPVPGGRHAEWGTANYLLGLGGSAYLEIIGPDEDRPAPAASRPFGIDELTEARLVTWAVRSTAIDAQITSSITRGYDPGAPMSMSRMMPTGELVRWRLTPATLAEFDGLVPFLIDWGGSPHPTSRVLPETLLLRWSSSHPGPHRIRSALAALGVELDIETSPRAGLTAVVAGRHGPVMLG